MAKILIFGAGRNGKIFEKYIKEHTSHIIIGWIDNKNDNLENGLVKRPEEIQKLEYDKIVVSAASETAREEIRKQLCELHVPREKCIFLLEDEELKTKVFSNHNRYDESDIRVNWVKSFSKYVYEEKINGSVAEAGVNRGEFAYYINKYFYDRRCYLFDTFEGFSEKDLDVERAIGNESFLRGEFNKRDGFLCTNINTVKKRMENINLCEFCVGYFPESAADVDDIFCFVNLDMDLYQPMLEGLRFFYPKMSSGGVILLHDFFHPELPSVNKAVKDYEQETEGLLRKFPIGDHCSIAVIK